MARLILFPWDRGFDPRFLVGLSQAIRFQRPCFHGIGVESSFEESETKELL